MAAFLNGIEHILSRQGGWTAIKLGVGFDGQLVPGNMHGCEINGLLQVSYCFRPGLCGQAVHQVQVDIVKTGGLGHCYSGTGIFCRVDPAQSCQVAIIKALNAN